jgi:hypothetical protein
MKTSLWIVIAVVAANVGFLVGYSVSSYTGFRKLDEQAAHAPGAAAPSYGAPAPAAAAPAYGAPAKAAAPAAGYGR